MNPKAIDIDVFREIMILPLRLSKWADRGKLEGWIKETLTGPGSPWKRATAGPIAAVAQSVAYPPTHYPPAPKETGADYLSRQAYGEAAYFHPFVQRFLYGTGEGADLQRFERDCALVLLRLAANDGSEDFEVDLHVERCELAILREPGLALLTLEVAASRGTMVRRGGSKSALSFADALAIHDCLRRVYPPFFFALPETGEATYDQSLFPKAVTLLPASQGQSANEQTPFAAMGRKLVETPETPETPVAPWWREILGPVLPKGKNRFGFVQVVDDRIPSMVFVGLPRMKRLDRSDLIRLCFADHPGHGYPYDPGFLANFERDHAYDRFAGDGTRFFLSSYSFVMVCQRKSEYRKEFDFALDVLQEHFRRHYVRMFFIVQMQRAGLLAFSTRMSEVMADYGSLKSGAYQANMREVRRRFVEFTHRYWFSNVSNQEQARDLFKLMQDHAGNPRLFEEVSGESAAARGEAQAIVEERLHEGAIVLNAFFAAAAIIGLPVAALQTFYDAKDMPNWAGCAMAASGTLAFVAVWVITRLQAHGWGGQGVLSFLFKPVLSGPKARYAAYAVALACLAWPVAHWGPPLLAFLRQGT